MTTLRCLHFCITRDVSICLRLVRSPISDLFVANWPGKNNHPDQTLDWNILIISRRGLSEVSCVVT